MRVDRRAVLGIVALATVVAAVAVLALDAGRSVDVSAYRPLTGPASPIGVPSPPIARKVYLAPFGEFPRAKAEALVTHYR